MDFESGRRSGWWLAADDVRLAISLAGFAGSTAHDLGSPGDRQAGGSGGGEGRGQDNASVTSFAGTENLRQRHHRGRAGPVLACAVVPSARAGGGVLAGRSGPGRSRVPPMRAPAAKMPAVHQNAVS